MRLHTLPLTSTHQRQPNSWVTPRLGACRLAMVLLTMLVLGGCRSGPSRMQQARTAFYQGDLEAARMHLQQAREHKRQLRDVVPLELAMVELAAGDAQQAEALLRSSRTQFDERDTSAANPSPQTLLTDDRDRPYDTVGYEDVMIRALLSITALLRQSGDAEAYANQAQLMQQTLARRAEERGLGDVGQAYQPLALSPYVRGLIRESTHRNYDDAERAYRLVAEWEPDFRDAEQDLIRATTGTHSQPGHGVLYVFALVGRGPIRVEERAEATSNALLIADRMVEIIGDQPIPPTLAPIPIPRVQVPVSLVETVGVRVGGVAAGTTTKLTDVGRLATVQGEAELPWTIARGVVRRVAKKALVATSANSLAGDSEALQTGISLLGSVWEATEHADTRCWSLLPREIQVLRVELPAGRHVLSANALGAGRELDEVSAEVQIHAGANSYAVVFAPDTHVTAMSVSGH